MKKIISVILSLVLSVNMVLIVNAESDEEAKIENNTEITAQAEKAVEDILDEFENNSDGLQEKVDKVIEENSESFIVKIFRSIIDAIGKFLDAIFELALEATKIR